MLPFCHCYVIVKTKWSLSRVWLLPPKNDCLLSGLLKECFLFYRSSGIFKVDITKVTYQIFLVFLNQSIYPHLPVDPKQFNVFGWNFQVKLTEINGQKYVWLAKALVLVPLIEKLISLLISTDTMSHSQNLSKILHLPNVRNITKTRTRTLMTAYITRPFLENSQANVFN